MQPGPGSAWLQWGRSAFRILRTWVLKLRGQGFACPAPHGSPGLAPSAGSLGCALQPGIPSPGAHLEAAGDPGLKALLILNSKQEERNQLDNEALGG